jgi:phosphopantothenoylcysteine synthetase/decarboxylase
MIANNATVYKNKNGYLCYKHNRKLVHRCVMEDYLAKRGEKLYPEEVVHHIDGNILNNDIDNLEVFANQSEHYKYHRNNQDDDDYDDDDDDDDDDYDDDDDDDDYF